METSLMSRIVMHRSLLAAALAAASFATVGFAAPQHGGGGGVPVSPHPAPKQEPASKPASSPAEGKLTAEERAHVVKLLRTSEEQLLKAIDGLSDAQWAFKPAPDQWSVGECVEHLLIAETRIGGRMEPMITGAPDPEWKSKTEGKTEMLERAVPDRSTKVKAPEAVQPTGKIQRAEAVEQFKKTRAKTLAF